MNKRNKKCNQNVMAAFSKIDWFLWFFSSFHYFRLNAYQVTIDTEPHIHRFNCIHSKFSDEFNELGELQTKFSIFVMLCSCVYERRFGNMMVLQREMRFAQKMLGWAKWAFFILQAVDFDEFYSNLQLYFLYK